MRITHGSGHAGARTAITMGMGRVTAWPSGQCSISICSSTSTGDGYRARVLRSPAGDRGGPQAVTFDRLFSDLELENFLLKIGRSRGQTRRIESAPVTAAERFGDRLFAAVFTGQVAGSACAGAWTAPRTRAPC